VDGGRAKRPEGRGEAKWIGARWRCALRTVAKDDRRKRPARSDLSELLVQNAWLASACSGAKTLSAEWSAASAAGEGCEARSNDLRVRPARKDRLRTRCLRTTGSKRPAQNDRLKTTGSKRPAQNDRLRTRIWRAKRGKRSAQNALLANESRETTGSERVSRERIVESEPLKTTGSGRALLATGSLHSSPRPQHTTVVIRSERSSAWRSL